MSKKTVEPTWPLLSVLVCLFVLSATSPSLWERAARNRLSKTPVAIPVPIATPQETIAFASDALDHFAYPSDASLPDDERSTQLAFQETNSPPTGGDKIPDEKRTAGEELTEHVLFQADAVPKESAAGKQRQENRRWPESVEELRALVLPTDPLGGRPASRFHDAQVVENQKEKTSSGKPIATEATASGLASEQAAQRADVSPAGDLRQPGTPVSAKGRVAEPGKPNIAALKKNNGQSEPNVVTLTKKSGGDRSAEPSVAPKAVEPPVKVQSAQPSADPLWPLPEALLAQLAELAKEPETRVWASQVEALVRKLGPALSEGAPGALDLAARLEQMSQKGGRLAEELGDRPVAAQLRRAVYALDRRLAFWKPIAAAGGLKSDEPENYDEDLRPLGNTLDEVDELLSDSPEGPGWRRFLELDALRKLVEDHRTATQGQARALARRILDRLVQVPMKEPQRRFLQQGPLAALHRDLRRVAAEPVFFKDLVGCVEKYEQEASPHDGRLLAELCQRLAHSKDARKRTVAQGLEGYYRNANVRLVVAVELLNRFIPERPKEYQDVYDVVLGKPVRGSSLTASRVSLRLIPDPQQIHVAFDVNGVVAASTQSVSGPATFYSDSQSVYQGWKEIEIGPEGMRIHPAQVAVNNESTLRGLSTDFDELPLIGALAQGVARSQHEQKLCEIRSEVERKIAARAQWQIDQETEARLGTAAEQVRLAVLEPLAELSLGPTLVSAETTDRRIAVRLRVASERQLGSHTPRPQAPADSAVSLQIHESALNNLFEQVGLNGATLTLPQLRARIAHRLKCGDLLRVDTENDDVTIAFAPRDAVRVACRDGQLILTLAVARLAKPPRAWEDFQVRVFLRPRVQGRTVELVREDVIQLVGSRLNLRSQIALRGVFGKTFSKDRPLSIVPERIVNEPRLQDLVFTQWVVEDGWIGAALGPGRVARKASSPDQDATRTN
jgi:hypothetical protein